MLGTGVAVAHQVIEITSWRALFTARGYVHVEARDISGASSCVTPLFGGVNLQRALHKYYTNVQVDNS